MRNESMIDNPQLRLAYDYVQGTGTNVFLTGKAGTGKTTFLHTLRHRCTKRMIVVAPTGVAALNAGGVTIHSFFQLPFGPLVPAGPDTPHNDQDRAVTRKFSRNKIKLIQGLDLLVIDEISMVRADLLDGIDAVLRRYRDRHRPFGGVQLLMIGDLQQLEPVIKPEDWTILSRYYETGFFFGSRALGAARFVGIELQHIYRQSDPNFIELLNKVRENRLDQRACELLNRRYRPDFVPAEGTGIITLTTHNAQAERINTARLAGLTGKTRTFAASVEGDFPEALYPTAAELQLKAGAQVMFVKNDTAPEKRYYNGKIGILAGYADGSIQVRCPDEDEPIQVEPVTWQNTQYTVDDQTKAIREEVTGTFTQIPLKLAWAVTIHKSQGLTFDRAVIDAQAAFAHGQVYVALSRCRSLEGLVLSTPIRAQGLHSHAEVLSFTQNVERNQPGREELEQARHDYQQQLLLELFDFTPITRALGRVIKRVREQAAALPANPVAWFVDLDRSVHEHIQEVSVKFHRQIKTLTTNPAADLEARSHLQERVQKGSAYFHEQLRSRLLDPMEFLVVETDNQTVRKSVQEGVDRLVEAAKLKLACLEACAAGFTVQTYLKIRAEARMDAHRRTGRRTAAGQDKPVTVGHPELYKQLKTWRRQKAQQGGIAPNSLLPLKVMIALADRVPVSLMQLKRIRGIGKKTMQRVGDELVAMLSAYAAEQGMPGEKDNPAPAAVVPGSTRQISLDLFNQGKSITEITALRDLARSTIEGHLAACVGSGDLPLERLMPREKAQPAIDFFRTADLSALSPAKEHFGEQYSYGELRMIVEHLKYTGTLKSEDG